MAFIVKVRYTPATDTPRYLAQDAEGWHTTGFDNACHFTSELEATQAAEAFRPEHSRIKIEVEEVEDLVFDPDWVSAPGDSINDVLEHYKLTPEWLAGQLSLTEADTQKLLAGDLEITDELAEKLATAVRYSKQFWINRERHYREGLAKGLKKV